MVGGPMRRTSLPATGEAIMIKDIFITVLVDNCMENAPNPNECGFSLWIEADDRKILFDTGRSPDFFGCAASLNIDLCSANTLIVSHGHYCSSGSVVAMLELNQSMQVYCHPGIFIPRYSRRNDLLTHKSEELCIFTKQPRQCVDTIRWVSGPTHLTDDIGLTGPISCPAASESAQTSVGSHSAPGNDSSRSDCALWLTGNNGLTVIVGCCKSGLVNTLGYIRSITRDLPIKTVIGGFHLIDASDELIIDTCDYLDSIGVERVVPCHCTGVHAAEIMEHRLGVSVVERGRRGRVAQAIDQ